MNNRSNVVLGMQNSSGYRVIHTTVEVRDAKFVTSVASISDITYIPSSA
jgi:hypothetical protein